MFEKWFTLEEQPYSEDDAAWDAFVAAHPHGSILQTTHWAQLKNRFNWSSQRVWLRQDGRLVAGAQVLFKSAALGLVKMAYIPHGPLVDWQNDEQVTVLLNQIDQAAYQHGAGLVKIEPQLWQTEMPPDEWAALCARHDLLPNADTIQPPNTVLVDLRPSLDDILAAMKQKTRYNIRLAERKDITVRRGTAADLPLFNALMQITARRDGFGVHDPQYYKSVFELYAPDDHLALFIAEFAERPLAAIMVSAYGRQAIYLYGASSDEERQRMPTYALQWAAIQWAKEKGCHTYDLWGIPDAPEEELEANFADRSDGLWGVYRAKRGYGGQVRRTVGAADRIYNQTVYKLYRWRRNR
ncbi:MAG: peptidoglycan bridge formation glycyltransferase FemA/FemB family protein [Chloroflexi bacterium]|nr:peptidoglycan bridge formation glycyltransferase FemA/FemB family protein [Chloroflexota bacterium]